MTDTLTTKTYNGWANYETWNVSLWLNNDEALYRVMVAFGQTWGSEPTYRALAEHYLCAFGASTPDGVAWDDPALDHRALDEMVAEACAG